MRYRNDTYAKDVWDIYWFDKNLQGDVVGVYNSTGTKLVSYSYDPWGKVYISYSSGGASTSATKNSLMYRGYYYDKDLGLYYLISRYYDANIGRFISADGYVSTGQGLTGYNMFAYCGNNPINRSDSTGNWWQIVAMVALAVTVLVNLTSSERQESTQELMDATLENDTQAVLPNTESSLSVSITFSSDNRCLDWKEYSNQLADKLENDYADYFGNNEIDREQLYGEIYFHYLVWEISSGLISNANPANLDIYSDGRVEDPRGLVNDISSMLGGM